MINTKSIITISTIFLLLVFIKPSELISADNHDLSFIQKWEGKYAFDKINGKSLWENKVFQSEMRKILQSKDRYNLLKIVQTGPEDPVTNYDGTLVFTACEQHNCIGFDITVLYEKSNNKLHVCWHCGSENIWFTSGEKAKTIKDAACACLNKDYNELIRKYSN